MTRKRALTLISVATLAFVSLFLLRRTDSRPVASVTFVGFTNDSQGFRSSMYRVPDSSARSMAVFRFTNHTSRAFFHDAGLIERRMLGGWAYDTNQWSPGSRTISPTIGGFGCEIIVAPTPAGTSAWRLNVTLDEPTKPPEWFLGIRARVYVRAGIHMPFGGGKWRRYTVTSEEVVR